MPVRGGSSSCFSHPLLVVGHSLQSLMLHRTAATGFRDRLLSLPTQVAVTSNSCYHGRPLSPVSRQLVNSEVTVGVGSLIWVTSGGGLISTMEDDNADGCSASQNSVYFTIREFCDQAVNDLTSVLRNGFLLKYQAWEDTTEGSLVRRLVATVVSPLTGEELKTAHGKSVEKALAALQQNLDTARSVESSPCTDDRRSPHDDLYDTEQELKALEFILNIFRDLGAPQCALNLFHCMISNGGDADLYQYVGTSSVKRRRFLERRKHIFSLEVDDVVCLVPGALYTAVTMLSDELLKHGGAMLLQELFEQYLVWTKVPLETRVIVGENKPQFVAFLEAFPWAFSAFPSRVFVSVRRRLPSISYSEFLMETFGEAEGSSLFTAARHLPQKILKLPPAVPRTYEYRQCAPPPPHPHVLTRTRPWPVDEWFDANRFCTARFSSNTSRYTSGGSSSSSSYLTDSVPSTPPLKTAFGADPLNPASEEPNRTEPLFWKSYEVCTEDLVGNTVTGAEGRKDTTNISSKCDDVFRTTTPSSGTDVCCQTDFDYDACLCHRCGLSPEEPLSWRSVSVQTNNGDVSDAECQANEDTSKVEDLSKSVTPSSKCSDVDDTR